MHDNRLIALARSLLVMFAYHCHRYSALVIKKICR